MDKERLTVQNQIGDSLVPQRGYGSDYSVSVNLSPIYSPDQGQGIDNSIPQCDAFQQEFDVAKSTNYGKDDLPYRSISIPTGELSEHSDFVLGARRTLSFPVIPCLSDTLDARWTGENQSGSRLPQDSICVTPDTTLAEFLMASIKREVPNLEDLAEYQNGSKSIYPASQSLDIVENSWKCLKEPFLNFYRSINKCFLTGTQKFAAFADYNPVYVSSMRKLELQSGAGLLLPIGVNDTVIPVYDDEPSSIISYALMSPEYHAQLIADEERPKDGANSIASSYHSDSSNFQSFHSADDSTTEYLRSVLSTDETIASMSGSRSASALDPLLYSKSLHTRVSFGEDGGKVKYTVTCYYAKRFEALRRVCCSSELDYIRSLSRCKKWGAQGGKSNVFFAKTLDDRFIIKQVTKTELESFIKFAPEYFKYLSESIGSGSPTCLAKILGIYQVLFLNASIEEPHNRFIGKAGLPTSLDLRQLLLGTKLKIKKG